MIKAIMKVTIIVTIKSNNSNGDYIVKVVSIW